MTSRLLCRTAVVVLIIQTFPISVWADDIPSEDWSQKNNYDVSWYKKSETEFAIFNSKELAGLAYLVNNGYSDFYGKTIKLCSDISLGEYYWVPIGIKNRNSI